MANLSDMTVATPVGSKVVSVEKTLPAPRAVTFAASIGSPSFEEHRHLMVDRPLFVRRARAADDGSRES